MVNLYVMKIKNDTFKYDNVPALWKDKVIAEFKRQVGTGEITKDKYKKCIGVEYSD